MSWDGDRCWCSRCSGWPVTLVGQALADSFFWVAVWATVGGAFCGAFTAAAYAELSGRVADGQRGRALGWVMSGQSLTLLVGVPMAAAVGSLIGWRGWLLCVGALSLVASRQHGDNRGSRHGRPYARRWCVPRSGTPCRSA